MRVLHYMPTNFGMTGVETFILQLCAAQLRAGFVPTVTMELAGRMEVAAGCAALGIPALDVPARESLEERLPRKLGTARLRVRRVAHLVRLLRRVDVLHVHDVGMAGLDALVAAVLAPGPSVVVTHHTTVAYFANNRSLVCRATSWMQRHVADKTVMQYEAAAADLLGLGFPKSRVAAVPNCVDEGLFVGAATPPRSGELCLAMAARLFDGKGHDTLFAALSMLRPRYPGLRAILLGDGPLRARLDAEVDRLGLRDIVRFYGYVRHAEMPAALRTAHVVVLPSRMPGETYPLSLLEGMALGLPAIGSRWGGIPDIIEDGETGFVVEPGDAAGLAAAVERLLLDPALYARLSAKAAARVQERFTGCTVAEAYASIYRQRRDKSSIRAESEAS